MVLVIIQSECFYRTLRFLIVIRFCFLTNLNTFLQVDSIPIRYDEILISKDTFFLGTIDSIVILQSKTKYKIKKNRDIKEKAFYDSLVVKTKSNNHLFSLHKSILIEEEKRQLEENPNFEKASGD